MKRRAFLSSIVMASAAIAVPLPKWIGQPAGGVYVPLPEDIYSVMDLYPWTQLQNLAVEVRRAAIGCIWAPPGSEWGTVSMWGGMLVLSEDERRQSSNVERLKDFKLAKLESSFRALIRSAHTPGRLRIVQPGDGPIAERERVVPVGYVKWTKLSTLSKMPMRIGRAA